MCHRKLPLNEVVFDFYDRLKSISRGYGNVSIPQEAFIAALRMGKE